MIVYIHPKCTTCKKALKWLEEHQLSYTTKDIREEHPSAQEFLEIQEKTQLPVTKMFNTSGESYRRLKLKTTLKEMPLSQAMELLAKDGMLIKRPLLMTQQTVLFGFKEEQYEQLLKGDNK